MNEVSQRSARGKSRILTNLVIVAAIIVGGILSFGLMVLYINIAADRIPPWILLNNTSEELMIHFVMDDRTYVVPSGETATVGPLHDWAFTIESAKEKKRNYQLAPVQSYRRDGVYLQIEPDGSIYLLDSKTEQPIKQLPAQPEGYPLRPR